MPEVRAAAAPAEALPGRVLRRDQRQTDPSDGVKKINARREKGQGERQISAVWRNRLPH